MKRLTRQESIEQIGVGLHTGIRKGCDSKTSSEAWNSIARLPDEEWSQAIGFVIDGLEYMGIHLYRQENES